MNQNIDEPILIGVNEVCAILGIKQSRAYSVIRQLNEKLKSEGKITVSGRINRKYLLKNFGMEGKDND